MASRSRAGLERPLAGALPADRPRPDADFSLGGLVNLAHGILCAGFRGQARRYDRLRRRSGASPAAVALIVLSSSGSCSGASTRGSRTGPADDLRSGDGREQALRWVFGAAPIPFSIPPALKGQILLGDFIYSKYRLLMSPAGGASLAVVPIVTDAVRTRRPGGGKTPTWSRRSAYRSRRTWRAWWRLRSRSPRSPASCWHRFPASIRHGRRYPDGVLRRRRHRRAGLVLGRGLGRADRRRRAGLTVYFPPAAEASMYLLMLLVLLFRPRGLFGERIQRFE